MNKESLRAYIRDPHRRIEEELVLKREKERAAYERIYAQLHNGEELHDGKERCTNDIMAISFGHAATHLVTTIDPETYHSQLDNNPD